MAESVEDFASNLMMKFLVWQITYTIKVAFFLLLIPFYLIRWLFRLCTGSGSQGSENQN